MHINFLRWLSSLSIVSVLLLLIVHSANWYLSDKSKEVQTLSTRLQISGVMLHSKETSLLQNCHVVVTQLKNALTSVPTFYTWLDDELSTLLSESNSDNFCLKPAISKPTDDAIDKLVHKIETQIGSTENRLQTFQLILLLILLSIAIIGLIKDKRFDKALLSIAAETTPTLSREPELKATQQKVAQQEQQIKNLQATINRYEEKTRFWFQNQQMLHGAALDNEQLKETLQHLQTELGLVGAKLYLSNKTKSETIIVGNIDTETTVIETLPLTGLGELTLYSAHSFNMDAARSFSQTLTQALEQRKTMLQQQKLLLIEERTSIARELHDSLAQALSYLKIQVSLLKKELKQHPNDKLTAITEELHGGLDAAYQQLRELLSTFRLSVKEDDLAKSLSEMTTQLQSQTTARITLNYNLENITIAAHKQIHLLQIIREATLNAIKHADCQQISINCDTLSNKMICCAVEDDGNGLPTESAKLNHYGMAIMNERAYKLGGELQLIAHAPKGTIIKLCFPE